MKSRWNTNKGLMSNEGIHTTLRETMANEKCEKRDDQFWTGYVTTNRTIKPGLEFEKMTTFNHQLKLCQFVVDADQL
jgi:hypothetical protein